MKKERLCKNIKVRLTDNQDKAVGSFAKEKNLSKSDVIRHALFDKETSSPYAIVIQNNLKVNGFINKIQGMDGIPNEVKEKIMKEINRIGQCDL